MKKSTYTLKSNGIIAVIGYNLMTIDEDSDKIIRHFYSDILGDKYWDKERKYLDEQYKTIPFPVSGNSDSFFFSKSKMESGRADWLFEHLVCRTALYKGKRNKSGRRCQNRI